MCKTGVLQPAAAERGPRSSRRLRGVRHQSHVLPSYRGNDNMERVTLRIPKQQIEEVEQMVETGKFPNRSEAIRSAVREMLSEHDGETEGRRPNERSWAKV